MSKYIEVRRIVYKGKTKKFYIISKSKEEILGIILWYFPWKQYCFAPTNKTIFNKDCLNDIQNFLIKLMEERQETIDSEWQAP